MVLEVRFEVVLGCEPVVTVFVVSANLTVLIVKALKERILV